MPHRRNRHRRTRTPSPSSSSASSSPAPARTRRRPSSPESSPDPPRRRPASPATSSPASSSPAPARARLSSPQTSSDESNRPPSPIIKSKKSLKYTVYYQKKHVNSCPMYLYHIKDEVLVSRTQLVDRIALFLEERIKHRASSNDTRSIDALAKKQSKYLSGRIRAGSAYAILSHRWEDDELKFGDLKHRDSDKVKKKRGFVKFNRFCEEAGKGQYHCLYAWADTACIDKKSSTDLDEAIRSMYNWYRNAKLCIVYLSASRPGVLEGDPWFKRGWTLQELLAPKRLKFFCKDWSKLYLHRRYDVVRDNHAAPDDASSEGPQRKDSYFDVDTASDGEEKDDEDTDDGDSESSDDDANHDTDDDDAPPPKEEMTLSERLTPNVLRRLVKITKIEYQFLENYDPSPANARDVFQWLSERTTSRAEDMSYCLLGLLDIQIPIAYGEGEERAFYRIQVECSHHVEDRSLFLWNGSRSRWNTMFADGPSAFYDAKAHPGDPRSLSSNCLFSSHSARNLDPSFTLTNCGLRIMVALHDVKFVNVSTNSERHTYVLSVFKKADTKVNLRWQGDPPASDRVTARWKVAVVGGFSNNAPFAILLREGATKFPPRYYRLSSAVFDRIPDLTSLTEKPPKTVWIQ
ncbi:hypothetical protein CCMSSC00406_0008008 [Pleurotus cornucopiae]|uniref:Uncharacterized protein n=1 Tax=Pleurotus cornucopiae TaxID=5321 RepID=A0ACB7IUX4_PLECO|nr:hypothetical protein CCMSSC00406_0008008 [Pleurotus cornucopiae]